MKFVKVIITAALILLFGTAASVYAQKGQGKKGRGGGKAQQAQKQQQPQDQDHGQERAQKQQDQNHGQPQAQQEQRAQQEQQVRLTRQRKPRPIEQPRAQQQQPARLEQQALQQRQDRPPGWDKGKKVGWGNSDVPPGQQGRLSQPRQRELIVLQQQRLTQYREYLDQQQRLAEQRTAQLQQQRRIAQYRYQQQYFERLRQQQMRLQSEQHDYNNDPYFYTAPSYRYNREGSYYETNQYGAKMLREAVNYGYEQGFRAGQADRQDRWNASYQDSYAYQDANYGYSGYYVDRGDYNYYFREGFRRGYEDGYNSRFQYGSQSNGSYSMLGSILSQILKLQPLR